MCPTAKSEDPFSQNYSFFITPLKNFTVFFSRRWDPIGQCLVVDPYKIPGDSYQNKLTPSTVGISKDRACGSS
jgi:hypothetical protein